MGLSGAVEFGAGVEFSGGFLEGPRVTKSWDYGIAKVWGQRVELGWEGDALLRFGW